MKFTSHEEITHHIYIEKKETRDFKSSVTTEKELAKTKTTTPLASIAQTMSQFLKNKGEKEK
jgi:hypothetical protein